MDIAVVGCGEISAKHIQFALDYPGARIVGLVDSNTERARKRAAEFQILDCYATLSELFLYQKPLVVHILTPPASHLPLVLECVEAGCHVLVEKPMGLNYQEALTMDRAAEKHGVSLCVDHNHFFDPCMVEARKVVERGEAGRIICVESHYGWNTDIPAVRSYPKANEIPWIYNLPGGVFHDIITHPLCLLLEYTGMPTEMKVMARSLGSLPQGQPDELRILCNGSRALGTLSISFNAKPCLHYLNLYGSEMFLQVNFDTMTFYTQPNRRLPKVITKPLFNLGQSWQLSKRTMSNTWKFLRGRLKSYHGMRTLIHQFYDSVQWGASPPVSREEYLQVARVIDQIWEQTGPRKLVFFPILPKKKTSSDRGYESPRGYASPLPSVLVTGASGFLGTHLARRLVSEGYPVRALVRKLSSYEQLQDTEIFFGDIRDRDSLRPAIRGVDMIVHAAAATSGSLEDSMQTSVKGTQNVLQIAQEEAIKRVVYISSLSVYDCTRLPADRDVREDDALESSPQNRGAYTYSKLEAEKLVQQYTAHLPVVILRPGTIHGPGGPALTPMIGYAVLKGLVLAIGRRGFELPLVYIDNLLDAIVFSLHSENAPGKIYNIVDEELIQKHVYIQRYLHKTNGRGHSLYLPYPMVYSLTWGLELLSRVLHKDPFLTRYRLTASCRNLRYDISRARQDLGWSSNVSLREGLENTFTWSENVCS